MLPTNLKKLRLLMYDEMQIFQWRVVVEAILASKREGLMVLQELYVEYWLSREQVIFMTVQYHHMYRKIREEILYSV